MRAQAAEDGDEPGGHRNYITAALQTGLCDWSAKYFAQPVMKVVSLTPLCLLHSFYYLCLHLQLTLPVFLNQLSVIHVKAADQLSYCFDEMQITHYQIKIEKEQIHLFLINKQYIHIIPPPRNLGLDQQLKVVAKQQRHPDTV